MSSAYTIIQLLIDHEWRGICGEHIFGTDLTVLREKIHVFKCFGSFYSALIEVFALHLNRITENICEIEMFALEMMYRLHSLVEKSLHQCGTSFAKLNHIDESVSKSPPGT